MTVEHYIQERERLPQAMNGQDRLMAAVKDISEALEEYKLDLMPGMAIDVVLFTLETIQIGQINLRDR